KLSAFFADVSEITYAPDVDQDGWRGESKFHRRDETVAARQYFGIIGVLRQQRERFIERRRRQVIELRWNHCPLLQSGVASHAHILRLSTFKLKVLHRDCRIRLINFHLMPSAIGSVILASNPALHLREIVFGTHLVRL